MSALKFNVWKGAKVVGSVSAEIEWSAFAPGNWVVVPAAHKWNSPWKFTPAKDAKAGLSLATVRALSVALKADPLYRGAPLGLRLTKDAFSHQPVVLMTVDEAQSEIEWLQSGFDACAEHGDGISSKDVVRMRDCRAKVFGAAGLNSNVGGY